MVRLDVTLLAHCTPGAHSTAGQAALMRCRLERPGIEQDVLHRTLTTFSLARRKATQRRRYSTTSSRCVVTP